MRRWVVVSLVGTLAVLVVAGFLIWRAVQPPEASAFYTPPSDVGSDQPGEVVRTERIDTDVASVRMWRMLYTSTDVNDEVVAVSALVAAPKSEPPEDGYPLVAVAHGTVGIAQGCAPSIAPFAKVDEENTAYDFLIGDYVAAGYAVVMADFEGLGVSGKNSYLVGEAEGRNVLDSVRAAKAFPEFEVAPGVLLTGQSQGGHATLFAGQLAPIYAPEVDVIGLAALAPATDLEAMFTAVTRADKRGGVVSLPVMAADAYAQTYDDVDIDQVLTRRGRGSLHNVIENLCLIPAVLATSLAKPSDLFRPDGLSVLGPRVRQNIPGTSFDVPVFVGQGDADQVVPPGITSGYARELCAAGVDLTFDIYPGAGHFQVVAASTSDVLSWMQAVRRGVPPQTTCSR